MGEEVVDTGVVMTLSITIVWLEVSPALSYVVFVYSALPGTTVYSSVNTLSK